MTGAMRVPGDSSSLSELRYVCFNCLGAPWRRRRFAGAERGSRVLQGGLNPSFGRVRATEHAPGGLFRALERRHGLAEIVERGAPV